MPNDIFTKFLTLFVSPYAGLVSLTFNNQLPRAVFIFGGANDKPVDETFSVVCQCAVIDF